MMSMKTIRAQDTSDSWRGRDAALAGTGVLGKDGCAFEGPGRALPRASTPGDTASRRREVSRAYRVTVKGSVHRVVHVEDGVCTSLELLPVLPPDRTAEILGAELEKRGFTRENGIARRVDDDGIIIEVDVKTGAVSVKAEATADIAIERERTERVVEEVLERGTQAAQDRVDREVARDAAAAEQKAKGDVAAKLERKLGDLRRELDSVTSRVTADALKEKARKIGEIEEMHEDVETGELTIKVRL
jgi:hypothetical protein